MNELLANNPGWEFQIGHEYVGSSSFKSEWPDFEIIAQYQPTPGRRDIRYAIYARQLPSSLRATPSSAHSNGWVSIKDSRCLPDFDVPVLLNDLRIAQRKRIQVPNETKAWSWKILAQQPDNDRTSPITHSPITHWLVIPKLK
jgi:hypothetical protein